jgi:hypothetical protein
MAHALPPHCPFNHGNDWRDGTDTPWGPIYALSAVQLIALGEYLDEILKTVKCLLSKSPAGASILLISKAHRKGLCLYIDYQGLNKFTILNRYLQPLMIKYRDHVHNSKLFTKIDLKARYNHTRIRARDE